MNRLSHLLYLGLLVSSFFFSACLSVSPLLPPKESPDTIETSLEVSFPKSFVQPIQKREKKNDLQPIFQEEKNLTYLDMIDIFPETNLEKTPTQKIPEKEVLPSKKNITLVFSPPSEEEKKKKEQEKEEKKQEEEGQAKQEQVIKEEIPAQKKGQWELKPEKKRSDPWGLEEGTKKANWFLKKEETTDSLEYTLEK